MKTVKQILAEAAEGSESTSTSTSVIRPSKAGAPLLVHVVEAFGKRLPQPPARDNKRDLEKVLASTMSTALGYLFENAVEDIISADFPRETYDLIKQPHLEFSSFVGTADYLAIKNDQSHAVVIDCKSFGCDTLREIKERKLTDNWGYRTQLGIYAQAVRETYGIDNVEGMWYAWSVPKRKLFRITLPAKEASKLAYEACLRVDYFKEVLELVEQHKFREAAEVAVREPLLPKDYYFGNLCAATGFHYNPLSTLFYPDDNDGFPSEPEELVPIVEALLKAAVTGEHAPDFQTFIDETIDNLNDQL